MSLLPALSMVEPRALTAPAVTPNSTPFCLPRKYIPQAWSRVLDWIIKNYIIGYFGMTPSLENPGQEAQANDYPDQNADHFATDSGLLARGLRRRYQGSKSVSVEFKWRQIIMIWPIWPVRRPTRNRLAFKKNQLNGSMIWRYFQHAFFDVEPWARPGRRDKLGEQGLPRCFRHNR